MDEGTIDSLNIQEAFVPKKARNVVYIKLPSRAKASFVYSHVTNMNVTNHSYLGQPSLVWYVPPQLYQRYTEVERLARDLRHQEHPFDDMVTNVRMGATDLELRVKRRDDRTAWRNVTCHLLPDELSPIAANTNHNHDYITHTPTKAPGRRMPDTTINSSTSITLDIDTATGSDDNTEQPSLRRSSRSASQSKTTSQAQQSTP